MGFKDWAFGCLCKRCNKNRTHNEYCESCEWDVRVEREGKRMCPVCGVYMKKKQCEGILIDKCVKCGGVWLDNKELETINDKVKSSAQTTAFLVGMAVG